MTTNTEIKTMFAGMQTALENLLDAFVGATNPAQSPPLIGRRIRTIDTNRNAVEFSVDDVWLMCALKKTLPDDPTRYIPVTRLIFRYTNAGNLITIDLDGQVEDVRRQIGGQVPDIVEMETPAKVMLRVAATQPAEIIAISSRGLTVTDANHDVWTIGENGQTMRNGVWVGGGSGSEYALLLGAAYVLGGDGTWWHLNIDEAGWTSVGPDLTGSV